MTKIFQYVPLILLSISLLAGCTKSKTINESARILTIDGSSTVYPITSVVVERYQTRFDDINFKTTVSGTGGGFSKFIEGKTDINNASRAISVKEDSIAQLNGISFKEMEVAYDGIAVVVNPQNTWVDYLTVAELLAICKEGGVSTWSEVRSEWPNEPIELYSPGEASGTFDYFTEVILKSGEGFTKKAKMSENDNLLALGISNNKYAFGFFGLAYFEKNKDKLRMVPIDGGSGPVMPNSTTIANGTYVPLSRPLYLYVTDKAFQNQEVKQFMKLYMESATEIAQKVGYVPLPSEKYKQLINEIGQ